MPAAPDDREGKRVGHAMQGQGAGQGSAGIRANAREVHAGKMRGVQHRGAEGELVARRIGHVQAGDPHRQINGAM